MVILGGPDRSEKGVLKFVGWREWVGLPDMNVDWVKAKIDTGARTSSLHAEDVELFSENGIDRVRFTVAPWQNSNLDTKQATADLVDLRSIRSSSGETEERPVILTTIRIAEIDVAAEITLTRRDEMGFRMLIGREALRQRFAVDSGSSYLGKVPSHDIRSRNRENEDDYDDEE